MTTSPSGGRRAGLAVLAAMVLLIVAPGLFWVSGYFMGSTREEMIVRWSSLTSLGEDSHAAILEKRMVKRVKAIDTHGGEHEDHVLRFEMVLVIWTGLNFDKPTDAGSVVIADPDDQLYWAYPVGRTNGDAVLIEQSSIRDSFSSLALWLKEAGRFEKKGEFRFKERWAYSRGNEFLLARGDTEGVWNTLELKPIVTSKEIPALATVFNRYDTSAGKAFLTSDARFAVRADPAGGQCRVSILDLKQGAASELLIADQAKGSVRVIDCEHVGGRLLFLVCYTLDDRDTYEVVSDEIKTVQTFPGSLHLSHVGGLFYLWDASAQRLLIPQEPGFEVDVRSGRRFIGVIDSQGDRKVEPQFPAKLLQSTSK